MMHDEALETSLQADVHVPAVVYADAPLTDAQLVANVLAGDERAFAEIFERYKRPVARTVGRFFRERSDIEEFVQQSFTKVYVSLDKFHGDEDSSLPAWISRIAINVCYDEFRRRQRIGQYTTSGLTAEEIDHLGSLGDGSAASAEDSAQTTQIAEKLLSSVSPKDRIALTLVYSQEYTLEEAAAAMGISSGSLKSRLFRCRNQLKKRFGYLFK